MAKNAHSSNARSGNAGLPQVAVVVSRYNTQITSALLEGAVRAYIERGGDPAHVHVFDAPGAFELPALALACAESHRYAGVVALGCLIRGETRHDRYIAEAVSHGLVSVTVATGVPVTFGVLTVDRPAQAKARAGGKKGNKGADAMHAALDTIAVTERIMLGNGTSGASITRALPDKTARKTNDGKDKSTKGKPEKDNGPATPAKGETKKGGAR